MHTQIHRIAGPTSVRLVPRFAIALSVFLLALVSGCAGPTTVVNGIPVYEAHWQQTTSELSTRAQFDLGCPSEHLELTLFRRLGRNPTEVGVTGCGQRATYIRPNMAGYLSQSWVLSHRAMN
jgi:hypothetical protein